MEINRKKLYRIARKIKYLVELDLGTHLPVTFFLIDQKTMKSNFGEGTKGYCDSNNIAICVENIVLNERLYNGFIKTVAHELRHSWQDDRERVFSKISKKYMKKAREYYSHLKGFKTLIRMEADALQYEDYFYKNFSYKIRKF